MFERLDVSENRFEELNRLLMDPALAADSGRMREVSIEHSELAPVVEAWREYKRLRAESAELEEMLGEPEMAEMAKEERERIRLELERLGAELRLLLLPKDPYDGRNIILEIRAGTGGDEAALFAGDLYRMYRRYCESKGWAVEDLSISDISVGGGGGKSTQGFKEIIAMISGKGAYSALKYESGVHRVQRVPLTETQGRIHTSAATVAIMPEAEEVDLKIEDKDLDIKVSRSGGPGGQSVNTTDSAVQIMHLPTGIQVRCTTEKSQHKNKAQAMKILRAKLLDIEEEKRASAERDARRTQVGSGDRSERIRTYNFPQNRVTDHRINLTLYQLDSVIMGDLDEMTTALMAHYQAQAIEEQDL